MTYEQNDNKYASSGVGTAGLTLGVIGTALASGIVGNGGVCGLFGNNNNQISTLQMENAILKSQVDVDGKLVSVYEELRKQDKSQDEKISSLSSRVLAIETASPLKEQIFDGKIAQVYDKMTCCCNASNAAIANLQASINALNSMTVLKIDANNVCPLPMQRYNSWVQPTSNNVVEASPTNVGA